MNHAHPFTGHTLKVCACEVMHHYIQWSFSDPYCYWPGVIFDIFPNFKIILYKKLVPDTHVCVG